MNQGSKIKGASSYFRFRKDTWIYFLLILIAAQSRNSFAESKPIKITYPIPQSTADHRVEYPKKLLKLALSKLENHYELTPYKIGMTQSRALKLLQEAKGLDVVWTMTNQQRESKFLPIRIPIYKGLSGWRLLIIKPHQQINFGKSSNLQDFKMLVAGQGHDWPDTQILRSNGIDVNSTPNYEALFLMLDKERFDFFPRMITEIWQEIAARPQFNFVVENNLVLRYPSAIYYFVEKQNLKLAKDIQQGLNLAITDGSFNALFFSYYQYLIDKSKLKQRKIISLVNPLLPSSTPLDRTELWYEPEQLLSN